MYSGIQGIDIFLQKYKSKKEKIFKEICNYLDKQNFKEQSKFIEYCKIKLSKEPNKYKILKNNLYLKLNTFSMPYIYLTDGNSSFRLNITFIKKIKINYFDTKKEKKRYIISEEYYNYLFREKTVKFKLQNCSETNSMDSFEISDILLNDQLDCLIVESIYGPIYKEIFNILEKESKFTHLTPNRFYNKYTLLNFPEINSNNINSIKWKESNIIFNNPANKLNIFYYNMRIGLSLYLQTSLIEYVQLKGRYFYCNVDFLFRETLKKKLRQYLFFYLSKLFFFDEYKKYFTFIENYVLRIINNSNEKKDNLIYNILDIIYNNFDEIYLTFDNIKDGIEFETIFNYFKHKTIKGHIYIYIQLNSDTLNLIDSKINHFKLIKIMNISEKILDNLDNYISSLNKKSENIIIKEYSNKIQNFFTKSDYENYSLLLKMKYLTRSSDYLNINKLKELSQFLEFIFVYSKSRKNIKICFRNNKLKKIFNDNYEGYVSKLRNNNNLKYIFTSISKSEEGINFEEQIIYDIITNDLNASKIFLQSIFSIHSFPNFKYDLNKKILFIQTNKNSPYYDFSFLIQNEGLNILKAYQIGINKGKDDLEKLNTNFLLFDLYYFCQKLEIEKEIKINKIELGLITTYNAYEEYKNKKVKLNYPNFENMKKFCENNSFEFLIFNTNNSTFYKLNENALNETNLIKNSKYQFDVKKIFNNDNIFQKSKKLNYYFKIQKNTNENKTNKIIIGKIQFPINLKIKRKYINDFFNYKRFHEKKGIIIEFYGNKKENDNNNKENEIEIEGKKNEEEEENKKEDEEEEDEEDEEEEDEEDEEEEDEGNEIKINKVSEEDDKFLDSNFLKKKRK